MTERYLAFDVETPNHENNRMSAIGLALVDEGEIVWEKAYPVNPSTYFDLFNVNLTGISPESVKDAPTLPTLWEEIGDLMQNSILVAHNAPFDMAVLSKCLRDYRLPHPRCLPYICTVRMGRKCFPDLIDHKLPTLCRAVGLTLDHHKAGSDSAACAGLLLAYQKRGLDPADFIRSYDVTNGCTLKH